MSFAAAIRTMLAAGLTIDQALIAVEAMEQAKGSRSSAAERQARYRERQKASRVTSRDVTSVTVTDDVPPTKETSPTPPKENYPLSSEPTVLRCESARRNVWPDDFAKRVWDAYPRKTEKQPGMAALAELHRKDRLDWQTLVAGIEALAANVEPKFAPALHRWLKKERWTDQHAASSPQARAGPAHRKTFGELARQAANSIAGQDHEPHFHRQADDFDGPSLDLVAGDAGASVVDLHPRRAARSAW